MKIQSHKDLRGRKRLLHVVSCLGHSCPWTESITSEDMLHYLESEIRELREEIVATKKCNERAKADQKVAMISELGDVLFDVLMLEMLLRREQNFGEEEAWQTAAEKIEGRTPYMCEWGDGISIAKTARDATKIWMAAKKLEQATSKTVLLSKCSQNDGTLRGISPSIVDKKKTDVVWTHVKRQSNLFGSVAIGFALGIAFANKFKIGR